MNIHVTNTPPEEPNVDLSLKDAREQVMTETGTIPTGIAPAIYQSVKAGSAATAFAPNLGTGGGMTQTGTLTIAGTNP